MVLPDDGESADGNGKPRKPSEAGEYSPTAAVSKAVGNTDASAYEMFDGMVATVPAGAEE